MEQPETNKNAAIESLEAGEASPASEIRGGRSSRKVRPAIQLASPSKGSKVFFECFEGSWGRGFC